MDVNSLIHHRGAAAAVTTPADGFRAPATNVSPFQTPSLPGLRAHLPSLPVRLAALQPATGDAQPSAAPRNPATASGDRPIAPSGAAPSSAPLQPATAASQQATSLAPLRFIIPSSHCPPSHSSAFAGSSTENATVNIRPAAPAPPQIKQEALATSAPKPYPESVQDQSQRQALYHTQNRPPPIDISLLIASSVVNDLDGTTDGSLTDNRNKKSPGKRNRAIKNPNRSTKSKARPGLRKGKWTEEEERYATQLTNYFKDGLLPIERGTMLRLYLSQKLNCEPMRITKKFTGGECIGKQVFRPCSPTPDTRVRLMQAQLELVALEAAFIKKLKENKEEIPGLTDDVDMNLAPGAIAGSARPKKRRPNRKADGGEGDDGFTSDSSTSSDTASTYSRRSEKKSGENVDDANAVGLLLDFFYKASSKNDPESKSEAAAAAAKDSQLPLFPKREVSSATSVASSEPDPELEEEQSYKQPHDELANSPTKRMRTLSISQCHTDVSTSPKRSRVGSFTAITSHP